MFRRRIDGKCMEDAHAIDNIEYNSYSGAQKNISVGQALEYVGEVTAATAIQPGSQLFIFKPTTGIAYIKLGADNSVTAPTGPAEDSFPVFGEQYTPISAAEFKFIIGSAAGIHLYLLRDDNFERVNP